MQVATDDTYRWHNIVVYKNDAQRYQFEVLKEETDDLMYSGDNIDFFYPEDALNAAYCFIEGLYYWEDRRCK